MPPQQRESIKQARQLFFDDGQEPRGLVSGNILASWRRCRQMGLVADQCCTAMPVEQHALRLMQERYERLRKLCRPELEALYAGANRADCIVILTAPDGFILDALGSPDFLCKAARVSLLPGVPWSEQTTGTNAIGTALIERRSVEVRGAEHYHVPHKVLSCSATPILDPHGKVQGVLDLSGESSVHHRLALGMVQLAVEQIEHRLFEGEYESGDIVRIAADPDLLGTAREGTLVFEEHRLVAANRKALRLLNIEWGDLGKLRYHELFASALPRPGNATGMRCQDGKVLHASRDFPDRPAHPARPRHTTGGRPPRLPSPVFTPDMNAQIDRSVRLLDADIPLLLQGETGTGKEVTARELHRRSARGGAAFVAVNCAALPENLIESELFGYLPGAFTGAKRDGSPGLLREADGGVLFLDEVGDMPLGLQSRLLRVLQEREVTPLGGSRAFAIDVVVISATHRNVSHAVSHGAFRADLYYRIAQSTLRLPPLRENPDLVALIREFWKALGAEQLMMSLHPSLLEHLASLPWPGNTRQLIAVLRSLMALGDHGGCLTLENLPAELRSRDPEVREPTTESHPDGSLQSLQQQAIRDAIAAANGSISAAAQALGISRSTIYRHLKDQDTPV